MADWATVEQGADMRDHMARMVAMRRSMLWCQWLTIGLGAWLATSPFQFALFDPATAASGARDITIERGLWNAATRNAITGWNDVTCGVLLMLLGALTLKARFERWQWATCAVGLWLLFAPLAFWTPSSAAYVNDTMIGALAIALSVLIPMMPGMNMDGMMDESDQPPGWSYAPSSWPQRLPIIALGALGYLIARYITAYQMGYTPALWDPFFAGQGGLNGSEYIVTSHVSKAWPIADGGLGATSYMLEVLMGAMGSAKRWRTMPWMVTFFFILVVPLGGVSIGFIIIQPIMLGTYCTLCLVQAFAMLLMIPLALDEVVAMGQYMKRSAKAGRPLIRTFFPGRPRSGCDRGQRAGLRAGAGHGAPHRTARRVRARAVAGGLFARRLADGLASGTWNRRCRGQQRPLGRGAAADDIGLRHGRAVPRATISEHTARALAARRTVGARWRVGRRDGERSGSRHSSRCAEFAAWEHRRALRRVAAGDRLGGILERRFRHRAVAGPGSRTSGATPSYPRRARAFRDGDNECGSRDVQAQPTPPLNVKPMTQCS